MMMSIFRYKLALWILALCFICGSVHAVEKKSLVDASTISLEAKVPPNHETSPYMLNLLMVEARDDMEDVPNAATIVSLKGQYEIKKHKFQDLIPRVKIDNFYTVSLKKEAQQDLPIDLAGAGPFYLAKVKDDYYLLTPKNFETIFGNLRNTSEALDYLVEYEKIFVSPVVLVATKDTEKSLKKSGRTPPRLSQVTSTQDGYSATMIIYSVMQVEGFFEKKVTLTKEGKVTIDIESTRLIQRIGEGIKY